MTPNRAQDVDLIHALLGNARGLAADSRLLFQAGRHARSYALAALAGEELGKIGMCLDRVLGEPSPSYKEARKAWHDHRDKLASLVAYRAAFVDDPTTLQPKQLKEEAKRVASRKMDALYVDLRGDTIVTPECIADVEAQELLLQVEGAIAHAVESLELLSVEVAAVIDGIAPRLTRTISEYIDSLPPTQSIVALRRMLSRAQTFTNQQWADALENDRVAELLALDD